MKGRAQKKNRIDAEEALMEYGDMVYRIALLQMKNRSEAEDVFQEVFLRLVKYHSRIEGQEHLKAWLIRVTINCCRKQFDNAYRRKTVPFLKEEAVESFYEMETGEYGVYEAVQNLPPDYRSVVHLFYYEQYTVRQISEVLAVSESVVKTRLSRARAKLKEILKGEFGNAGAV